MDQVGTSPERTRICGTCGRGFAQQGNLDRHFERQHTDQTTLEALTKRQNLREYARNYNRKRRGKASAPVAATNEAPAPVAVENKTPAPVAPQALVQWLPHNLEALSRRISDLENKFDIAPDEWRSGSGRSGHDSFEAPSLRTSYIENKRYLNAKHMSTSAEDDVGKKAVEKGEVVKKVEAPAPVTVAGSGGGGGGSGGGGSGGGGGGGRAYAPERFGVTAPPPSRPAAVMVMSKDNTPVWVLPTQDDVMRFFSEM